LTAKTFYTFRLAAIHLQLLVFTMPGLDAQSPEKYGLLNRCHSVSATICVLNEFVITARSPHLVANKKENNLTTASPHIDLFIYTLLLPSRMPQKKPAPSC
jgi:hypothetical protein